MSQTTGGLKYSHSMSDTKVSGLTNKVFQNIIAVKLKNYVFFQDTFDMKDSMERASALMQLLSGANQAEVEPAWSNFLAETSQNMQVIKSIKWDPTDHVDKEIYDMQV